MQNQFKKVINKNLNQMLEQGDQKVIQLVGIDQKDKRLYLTEEGKNFLEQLDTPISVITIAGLYRTGKSYLVNQLLSKLRRNTNCKQKTFQVGNTIQSCTKGLNVWAVPCQSNLKKPKFNYIIIDSEGIGSMEQQQNYDMNLLILIFLISSTVIYNSVGAIDEQSLDQLRVIINLKKSLGQQSNTQPRLIWVLRDFALQLINKKGQTMTPDQYLEDCLQQVSSANRQIVKKNEIRQAIKQSLPNRQCHTLVRPTIKQHDLADLLCLPQEKLRHQFVEQVDKLFSSIFRHQIDDIKFLNDENNFVDGSGLAKMIEYYLSEINCDKIPQVKSVWELIQSTKLDELFEECQNQLKSHTLKIGLPLPQDQLKQRLNQIQNKVFSLFEKQLPSSDLNTYKRFNQKFIKLKQKINAKIRKANFEIKRKKRLKQVRGIINKEVQFDQIDPCSISYVRQVVEKLQLKNIADPQIYEYVISSLLDFLDIAQEKAIVLKEELDQYKNKRRQTEIDQNSKDQQLLKLKQDYSLALKQISFLKSSQFQNQKQLAFKKQQLCLLESKTCSLVKQKAQREDELRKKVQELNQKIRRKNEQNIEGMKSLRNQNQSLLNELEQTKNELNLREQGQRKQLIFGQKIKQSWDRFEEQRAYFKRQLDKFKQLYFESQEKTRLIAQSEQNLVSSLRKERQVFERKQRQFCEQLKWMKQNYSKTKAAYSQSLNTRMENEQILKDITMGAKKKNTPTKENCFKAQGQDKITAQSLKPLKLACESLNAQKNSLERQILACEQKVTEKENQITQVKEFYEKKILNLEERIQMLQNSQQAEKQRFYSCLKQLQHSKESERQIYEDSIMRLLNNMEHYEALKSRTKISDRINTTICSQKTKNHLY